MGSDASGFYVNVLIDGQKMQPLSLGGANGWMMLCQTLRNNFEEFKYTYQSTSSDYSTITGDHLPMGITKKYISGSVCFLIETMNGTAYIAMSSVMEVLKNEKLITAVTKSMGTLLPDCEKKFNDIIKRGATDLAAVLEEGERTGNLLLIEIVTNFNELFKICVEETTRQKPKEAAIVNTKPNSVMKRKANNNGNTAVEAKNQRCSKPGQPGQPKQRVKRFQLAPSSVSTSSTKPIIATINLDGYLAIENIDDIIEEEEEEDVNGDDETETNE